MSHNDGVLLAGVIDTHGMLSRSQQEGREEKKFSPFSTKQGELTNEERIS
jgi:hypothetical protein